MKIIEPAIGSIWERADGTRFIAVAFISAADSQECQLQAVVSGRRHWVTSRGLGSYRWISDPTDEDDPGSEDDVKELEP